MAIVLNIENWQIPTSKIILDIETPIKTESENTTVYKLICWNSPEVKTGLWFNTFDKNNFMESKLLELENLINKFKVCSPIDKIGIVKEYREAANFYNSMVGFQCMEEDLLKVNIPLTKQAAKIQIM